MCSLYPRWNGLGPSRSEKGFRDDGEDETMSCWGRVWTTPTCYLAWCYNAFPTTGVRVRFTARWRSGGWSRRVRSLWATFGRAPPPYFWKYLIKILVNAVKVAFCPSNSHFRGQNSLNIAKFRWLLGLRPRPRLFFQDVGGPLKFWPKLAPPYFGVSARAWVDLSARESGTLAESAGTSSTGRVGSLD